MEIQSILERINQYAFLFLMRSLAEKSVEWLKFSASFLRLYHPLSQGLPAPQIGFVVKIIFLETFDEKSQELGGFFEGFMVLKVVTECDVK